MQTFSIDLQQSEIQERAHFQEYFVQDDWRVSRPPHDHPGPALHAELSRRPRSTDRRRSSISRAKLLDYPGDEPVRPLKKNNFGPRLGVAYRLTDKTLVSTGYGLVWIEMAGITTPFTTPTFPFLQTVSAARARHHQPGVRAAERSERGADRRRRRTPAWGRACSAWTPTLGSGYVQQWNASVQRELGADTTVEVAYVGSKITHVGIPDTNLNQLTVDQLALGTVAAEARAESVLRHHPALVVARRSDDHRGAAAQAVSRVHDRQPVPQQRRRRRTTRA